VLARSVVTEIDPGRPRTTRLSLGCIRTALHNAVPIMCRRTAMDASVHQQTLPADFRPRYALAALSPNRLACSRLTATSVREGGASAWLARLERAGLERGSNSGRPASVMPARVNHQGAQECSCMTFTLRSHTDLGPRVATRLGLFSEGSTQRMADNLWASARIVCCFDLPHTDCLSSQPGGSSSYRRRPSRQLQWVHDHFLCVMSCKFPLCAP
jgi:hypothetical protein